MNKEGRIFTRRQLLDWRDKHIENIHHHLSREISLLFNELDYEIDKMTLRIFIKARELYQETPRTDLFALDQERSIDIS